MGCFWKAKIKDTVVGAGARRLEENNPIERSIT
jgi:hypothetical protein